MCGRGTKYAGSIRAGLLLVSVAVVVGPFLQWMLRSKGESMRVESLAFSLEDRVRYVQSLPSTVGITRAVSHFVTDLLQTKQHYLGIRGQVGEIGTFHGKFAITLMLGARKDEIAEGVFIADAFENLVVLGGNPNGGTGCKKCFERQVGKYAGNALSSVRYFHGNSVELNADVMNKVVKNLRMFSIDGDHSLKGTMTDLCVVAPLLVPGGIIILDDICNPGWPSVEEAWQRFVHPGACSEYLPSTRVKDAAGMLVPFAVIGCKLFITTKEGSWADLYRDTLAGDEKLRNRYLVKDVTGGDLNSSSVGIPQVKFEQMGRYFPLDTQVSDKRMLIQHENSNLPLEKQISDELIRYHHIKWLKEQGSMGILDK